MNLRRSLSLVLTGMAVLAAGCATTQAPVERTPPPPPEPVAAQPRVERAEMRTWVEMGSQGAIARAVLTSSGASCPDLMVDGAPQPMTTRSAPQSCFDVLVCEAPIPAGASDVSVGATRLPLPPKDLKRIAVIGDTGCRLKGKKCTSNAACVPDCEATTVQACNDPEDWPFATIAELVAKTKPDLVVHVGDYHYREAQCPKGKKDCAGSPAGDNWPAWKADFFDPAAPLLAAAPWVMVRGNHEDCSRAGWGWFRLLDPGALPSTCNDDPTPYPVGLPGLQLLVLNTSAADDEQPAFYAPAYRTLNQLAAQGSTPSWLLSHHPLWGFAEDEDEVGKVTQVLQEALGSGGLDSKISLVGAGHIHLFEAIGFGPTPPRVPSIVFGMSGTKLDKPITTNLVGETIDGAEIVTADVRDKFGYALAEPDADGWKITVYSKKGNPKVVCEVEGTALKCEGKE
ncbi:MAG TPA: metallophosphoesterase [Thermoanaerobaculia bacterium]